jgi:RNA polymerase sigma factor (sigma-70 family)
MARGYLGSVVHFLRRVSGAAEHHVLTDRELLHRFSRQADADAFSELVRRHGPMVLAVCRRVLNDSADVEDAFQATFVVLSRRAATVGWQDSIANWLYGVAYRVAGRARGAAAIRRRHESQVPDMHRSESLTEVERQELRSLLDDELNRLPEKYRAPLVLCYLEGKTNDEAAQQLGWSKGTVSGRLARARDLLRARLARRNLVLPATAVTAVLMEVSAPAAVPAALLASTVQAALPTAGTLVAPVATLVEGVLHTMLVTRLKIAAVLLLAVGVLGSGAGLYWQSAGRANPAPTPDTETKADKQPPASEPVVKDGLSITIRPTAASFQAGKALFFNLTFKNESKAPYLLYDVDWVWSHDLRFYQGDRPGEGWDCRFPINLFTRRAPKPEDSVVLEPGQSHEVRVGTNAALYPWCGKSLREPASLQHLAPGKYNVIVTRKFTENSAKGEYKHRHWTGTIESKPVTVEIVEEKGTETQVDKKPAASEPVAKDGLSVTIRPTAATFEAGKALLFNLTFKNESKAPFLLYDVDWGWSYHLRFYQGDRSSEGWDCQFLVDQLARRAPKPEDSRILEPGQSHEVRVSTNAALYSWRGKQLREPPSLEHLAPGKYNVIAVRTFDENSAKGEYKHRHWTGTIASKPITSEISAEAPKDEKT